MCLSVLRDRSLQGWLDHERVDALHDQQQDMLRTLQAANMSLDEFMDFAQSRYVQALVDFKRSTQLLKNMQVGLDDIFRRVRVLRNRVKRAFPESHPEDPGDDVLPEERLAALRGQSKRQRESGEDVEIG